MGAEAEDCHLSGYTQVYINGRAGDISILERTSTKSAYITNIVFQWEYMSLEHNILRALRIY